MKENPANTIKDTMWKFLMDRGQKANVPALKEYVYDLVQLTTQKTSGNRKTAKKHIPWEELDMTLMSIVIEATALVLSGELDKPKITEEILKSIKTIDGVVPPPSNKMVDLAHLHIAVAWKTIREYLLQNKEDAE